MIVAFESFTLAAVVDDLDRAAAADAADAIEFRMDQAESPLDQLVGYDGEMPVIATNRRVEEGGAADGPDRVGALATAATAEPVVAIDVELATIEAGDADDVLARARAAETPVIVSWHDFEGTPARERLEGRLRAAATHGMIAKAAVTATTLEDVLRVLSVTSRLTNEGIDVATMCMGEVGQHSRVVAPLYGSKIGYAPITPVEATAPGQYDLATMRRLIDALS